MASQLVNITIPSITDPQYAEGLSNAFENINNNFKIIASLPYLQGAQGDSFEATKRYMWEKINLDGNLTKNNAKLTKYGVAFLKSEKLFPSTTISVGQSFNTVRTKIGYIINGISPIDSFVDKDDNIINNTIYMYSLYNDANELEMEYTGQFFYFIDKRITILGSVDNISGFNDYTGFFACKFTGSNIAFEKINLLPTLYYDESANDICWKFNGNESGISATGVSGKDGASAYMHIVKTGVRTDENIAIIAGGSDVFFYATDDAPHGAWHTEPQYVISDESPALICFYNGDNAYNWVFGTIKKVNNNYTIYWDNTNLIGSIIGNRNISDYFHKINSDPLSTADVLGGLIVPIIKDDQQKAAHVLRDTSESDTKRALDIYPASDCTGDNEKKLPQVFDNDGNNYTLNVHRYGVVVDNSLETNDLKVNNSATIGNLESPNLTATDATFTNLTVKNVSNLQKTVIGNNYTTLNINPNSNDYAIETSGNIVTTKNVIAANANIKDDIIFDNTSKQTHKITATTPNNTKIQVAAKEVEFVGNADDTVGIKTTVTVDDRLYVNNYLHVGGGEYVSENVSAGRIISRNDVVTNSNTIIFNKYNTNAKSKPTGSITEPNPDKTLIITYEELMNDKTKDINFEANNTTYSKCGMVGQGCITVSKTGIPHAGEGMVIRIKDAPKNTLFTMCICIYNSASGPDLDGMHYCFNDDDWSKYGFPAIGGGGYYCKQLIVFIDCNGTSHVIGDFGV